MIDTHTISQAEKMVKKKAAEIAFKRSNDIDNSEIQSLFFKIYKDCIILGARLMQEELMKIEEGNE